MVTQKDQIDINIEYADVISKLTSNHSSIESFKHHIPEELESRDLMINKNKTKQHNWKPINGESPNIFVACLIQRKI